MKILSKYPTNNYIIIISDGNSCKKSENINNLILQARKMNITIATFLLSKNKNIKGKFYKEFPNNLNQDVKILFDISSKVNYKNPFSRYYIKKDYDFPNDGEANLLLETNFEEIIETNSLANNLNYVNLEGINIKIGDLNYESFICFKFKFIPKNQIFGTCWANACAGGISLTYKRILGKKIESFQSNKENLIKFASFKNEDGGRIDCNRVKRFFDSKNIHIKNINEVEARTAIMKGRFILCSFRLSEKQWKNFSNFYREHPTEILTSNIINNECEITQKDDGHAVLLIEINVNYLRFLNTWGANWAEEGTFKIENFDVLTSKKNNRRIKLFDIVFYEHELSIGEKNYYYNNIDYIRELLSRFDNINVQRITNYMNDLYENIIICDYCGKRIQLDEFKVSIENGFHKIFCPFCKVKKQAEGITREWLILKDLICDGNPDFDINFQENQYIKIYRLELHNSFKNNIENESDLFSIGNKNECEKKIDSHFVHKVNSIICLENGKFVASDTNLILVFKLREIRTREGIEGKIDKLIFKNISEDISTLCDLKLNNSNLIASGGEALMIFEINYLERELILKAKFSNNKKINKILLININQGEIIK